MVMGMMKGLEMVVFRRLSPCCMPSLPSCSTSLNYLQKLYGIVTFINLM